MECVCEKQVLMDLVILQKQVPLSLRVTFDDIYELVDT